MSLHFLTADFLHAYANANSLLNQENNISDIPFIINSYMSFMVVVRKLIGQVCCWPARLVHCCSSSYGLPNREYGTLAIKRDCDEQKAGYYGTATLRLPFQKRWFKE